jgi:hypothetical protein
MDRKLSGSITCDLCTIAQETGYWQMDDRNICYGCAFAIKRADIFGLIPRILEAMKEKQVMFDSDEGANA